MDFLIHWPRASGCHSPMSRPVHTHKVWLAGNNWRGLPRTGDIGEKLGEVICSRRSLGK